MGNNNKNIPLTDKHARSRFMWRITNTEILLGWENKMFLSLFSLSGWEVWMSEWVTGQPAVSGYFLKLFIHLSFILRFSDFLWRLVGRFGVLANVLRCKAAAFEQLTCRNAVELQLTVSCLVEERGSAVGRAPLRAAWNWFLRWTLFWWPSWTERGRKTGLKEENPGFKRYCRPSGIKKNYYLSVDTQPSIHSLIHNHGNWTLNLLAVRQLCLCHPAALDNVVIIEMAPSLHH